MRHYNEGPKVEAWHDKNDQGSSHWDLCRSCSDIHEGKNVDDVPGLDAYCWGTHSHEPNGVLSEGVSPGVDYEDEDRYSCACCGKELTEADAQD